MAFLVHMIWQAKLEVNFFVCVCGGFSFFFIVTYSTLKPTLTLMQLKI